MFEFKVMQGNLKEAVEKASKVIGKTTLPILENLLLISKGNDLRVIGNNLSTGIEVIAPLETTLFENTEGRICIDAKLFTDIVKKLPNDEVEIRVGDTNLLIIRCNGSEFKIQGISAADFPLLPEVKETKKVTLTQEKLKDVITKTIFAAANDEIRPVFTGVLFDFYENNLNLVATDGYRIAWAMTHTNESINNKIVVHKDALKEVQKNLVNKDELAEIFVGENYAIFKANNTSLVTRLLQGDFMNYKSMFPTDGETIITIDKDLFTSVLDRALIVGNTGAKVPIKLDIKENLTVMGNTDRISIVEKLNIEQEGKHITIAFNPLYLLEGLKVFDEDKVNFYFNSPTSPSIIKSEKEYYKYLVLPVRTMGN